MASLIKKITSVTERLPEGIQRAHATIQGTRRFDRRNPHPFLSPVGISHFLDFLDSPPGLEGSGRGSRDAHLEPAGRSPRDFILCCGFYCRRLLVVDTSDLIFCIRCGSDSYICTVLQAS